MMNVEREPIQVEQKAAPEQFLEPEVYEDNDSMLPPELSALYKTVRIFGHFEKPVFFNLCKHMTTIELREGEYLFRRGDHDEFIHVVQEGQVDVFIRENVLAHNVPVYSKDLENPIYSYDQDKRHLGNECRVAEVTSGESIHSLLSVLDVLTGHSAPYKTVSARAVKHTKVLRLPVKVMKDEFEHNPDALIRLVQIIAMRLQRVTMFALHNYLGLTHELINAQVDEFTEDFKSFKISKVKDVLKKAKRDASSGNLRDLDQKESLHSLNSTHSKTTRFAELETVVNTDPLTNTDHIYNRHVSPQNDMPNDEMSKAIAAAFSRESTYHKKLGESKRMSSTNDTSNEIREFCNDEVLEMAKEDITTKLFGLPADKMGLLDKRMTLLKVPKRSVLTKEGDFNAALYFLVKGRLTACQENEHKETETIYDVLPGMITGQLAVLTGEPSMFKVIAREESIVVRMLKSDLFGILRENTNEASTVIMYLSHSITSRMSPFVRQIDFALDWMTLESGKVLFRQKDKSDASYIVLNGRLRSVVKREELIGNKIEKVIDAEYGRGDIIGLAENIKGNLRQSTVHAVRDTELARIPDGLLTMIRKKYPSVTTRIAGFLGSNVLKEPTKINSGPRTYGDLTNLLSNLSTVAIIGSNESCPVEAFSKQLEKAVENICATARLTSDRIIKKLGPAAFDQYEYQLTSYLGTMEEVHRLVMYQCDDKVNAWTRRCIRQADAVLIVAKADSKPQVGELEREIETMLLGRSLKVLVMLHPEATVKPTRTAEWLNLRSWLTTHFHLKCPDHFFGKGQKSYRKSKKKVSEVSRSNTIDQYSDFSRLARFITGTSIAVVFGGGGARGIAQLGILKTLLEAGIPVDIVGGTSIGSFNAALYAKYRDMKKCYTAAENFSKGMSNIWMKILDLTYPITSLFSGSVFGSQISQILDTEQQIEDLWIPYFAISTNLVTSRMRVHTNGSLWRYVRASMSLAGYLPPICDPKDNHMLMDGGYINNLPADVAKDMFGACKVVAMDVGNTENFLDYYAFGDALSGWQVLFSKWNPFAKKIRVPEINDIQSRLAYITCHKQLEKIKQSDYCYYVRPPVQRFKTLAFDRFEELDAIGRFHAEAIFTEKWVQEFISDLMGKMRANQVADSGKIFSIEKSEFKDLVDVVYNHDRQLDNNSPFDRRMRSRVDSSSGSSPVPKSLKNVDMRILRNANDKFSDRRSSQDGSIISENKMKVIKEDSRTTDSDTNLLNVENHVLKSNSFTNMKKSSSAGNMQIIDDVVDDEIMNQLQDRIGEADAKTLVEELMAELSSDSNDEEMNEIDKRKRSGSVGNIPRTGTPNLSVDRGLSRQITDSPLVRLTPVPGGRLASGHEGTTEHKSKQKVDLKGFKLEQNENINTKDKSSTEMTQQDSRSSIFRIGGSISEAVRGNNSDSDDDIY
jgi:lysophospholipid hydrolase